MLLNIRYKSQLYIYNSYCNVKRTYKLKNQTGITESKYKGGEGSGG